ncbi:MAG: hypothetical protein ABIQ55_01230 [Gemmatimonadaceae bacterium]
MNTLRGSRNPVQPPALRKRTPSRPFVASIVFHVLLVAGLVKFLVSPAAFTMIFGPHKSVEIPAERIGFLRLPKADGAPVAGKSGGDNKPVSKVLRKALVAPTTIPTTIPTAPISTTTPTSSEGSGPLVGGGGPTRGIRPTYGDPRLWSPPGDLVQAPKSARERLDSTIVSLIAPFNDSIAAAAGERKPGDWTFDRDGKKYGIDQKYIHLGKFSIPTAVLALLPINQSQNPATYDRNKASNQMHADIFWNAQRGMNDVDFKKAVRSIRERKEREKAQAEKKKRQADQPAAQSPTDR